MLQIALADFSDDLSLEDDPIPAPHRPPLPEIGLFIEVLIKLLESGLTAFSMHMNIIKITIPQMAVTSKDELLLGGGLRHLTATSQYHAHSRQVSACVSNIV